MDAQIHNFHNGNLLKCIGCLTFMSIELYLEANMSVIFIGNLGNYTPKFPKYPNHAPYFLKSQFMHPFPKIPFYSYLVLCLSNRRLLEQVAKVIAKSLLGGRSTMQLGFCCHLTTISQSSQPPFCGLSVAILWLALQGHLTTKLWLPSHDFTANLAAYSSGCLVGQVEGKGRQMAEDGGVFWEMSV